MESYNTAPTDPSLLKTKNWFKHPLGPFLFFCESRNNYTSGFAIYYLYNSAYGNLSEVKRKDNNQTIWKAGALNEFGQWKDYTLGNSLLKTQKSYDGFGQLSTIKTQNLSTSNYLQDMEYSFNTVTGNLSWRKDHRHKIAGVSLNESFDYDTLNRIMSYYVNTDGPFDVNYDDTKTGNITNKDPIGEYKYTGPRPHALTRLDKYSYANIPIGNQHISYTSFNKVDTIIQGSYKMIFTYGPMEDRKKARLYYNNSLQKEIFYHDGFETDGSLIKHYIAGGDGLAAMYTDDEDGHLYMHYVLKDHLGSHNVIADRWGEIALFNGYGQPQEYSFDTWGRRRNPNDWS